MTETNQYRQNAFAVVIGINKYRDPKVSDLVFARDDAEGVYNVLTDPTLGKFSPDNVFLLVDEDATQRNIRTVVGNELRRKTNENDLVYIYYAGHGSAEIDPHGKNNDGIEKYIIPHDAELDNLFATGIAMDEVQRFFHRLESKQIIFFIDSCYSGEAGGRTFLNPNYQKRAALSGDFLDGLSGEGRLVVTACDVNEVSLETPQKKHGLFTYHLIEGLRGKADMNGDGLVTMNELYDYLYKNVLEESKMLGGSMHPVQKGFVRGELYLTKFETEAQKEAAKLNAKAVEAFEKNQFEKAQELWAQVLELIPDYTIAIEGIKEIEQQKAEKLKFEEALMERKNKIKKVIFDLAGRGVLPDRILRKALDVISGDPKQFKGNLKAYNQLLNKLAQNKINVGEFIEEWFRIETADKTRLETEVKEEPTKVVKEKPGGAPEKQKEIEEANSREAVKTSPEENKKAKTSVYTKSLHGRVALYLIAVPLGITGLMYALTINYPIYLNEVESLSAIFSVLSGVGFMLVAVGLLFHQKRKQAAVLFIILIAIIVSIKLLFFVSDLFPY